MMRPGREWRGQRGAFTPLMGAAVLLLAVVGLGGLMVGRLSVVKADSQRAADAAALAAAQAIRERGLPFDGTARGAAEAAGRRNTQLPVDFDFDVVETEDSVDIRVTTQIQVSGPQLVVNGGSRSVSSTATASVEQTRFDEAERRLPKLVLVLDYSGSMSSPFSGGGGRAIDVLEASVRGLLAADLRIDYGGVFYSTNVFRTHAISDAAPGQIASTMDTFDAGGTTNTASAITAARNLLSGADDTGRFILVVSDGEPCCASNSFSAARNAANAAWNIGATIFTLEIRRSGSSAALDQFMTDIAGEPTSRGDRNFHFVATSASDLADEFNEIVANIVCSVGPVEPLPDDMSTLKVFLSGVAGDREVRPIGPGDELADFRTQERYRFDTDTSTIRLTEAACDAVIDNGDEVVLRYDRPILTE